MKIPSSLAVTVIVITTAIVAFLISDQYAKFKQAKAAEIQSQQSEEDTNQRIIEAAYRQVEMDQEGFVVPYKQPEGTNAN